MTKKEFDKYIEDGNNEGELIGDFGDTMMEEIKHLPKYNYFKQGENDGIMCDYMDELIEFYIGLKKERKEQGIKNN